LGRKVDAGEEDRGDLRDRRGRVRQPCLRDRAGEEALEDAETAVDAEVVRRAERSADEREQRSVAADQGEVRLRVPTVDGEDDAHAACSALASSSRSTSSSASAYCAISGCASSALRASTTSPVVAACAASRS